MDVNRLKSEIFFKAHRSSGPGGQNVNKVSSAIELNWDYKNSLVVNDHQKYLIESKLSAWINADGIFKIKSDVFRDQPRNKVECLEKLEDLLKKCFEKPKRRIPTKPTRSSRERKLQSKHQRAEIKTHRRKVDYD
jgi:ribosome-associated protein